MATVEPSTNPQVHFLSDEEGRAVFDRAARRYLRMSGEEFLRAWKSGQFAGNPDQPNVMPLIMLLPLVE